MSTTVAASQVREDAKILKCLRSRSQKERQWALTRLAQLPTCQSFKEEVLKLCQSTKCHATWSVAKRVLFGLDPAAAVEMDKKHKFSELRAWNAGRGR